MGKHPTDAVHGWEAPPRLLIGHPIQGADQLASSKAQLNNQWMGHVITPFSAKRAPSVSTISTRISTSAIVARGLTMQARSTNLPSSMVLERKARPPS